MAKSALIEVASEVLVWARRSAGLDLAQAARKAQVTEIHLQEWEQSEEGQAKLSISQLRRLAEVYKRPLAVFLLSEPPRSFDAIHDYRRLPDQPQVPPSPSLAYEIRRAHFRRQIALELASDSGVEYAPLPQIGLRDDPEEVSSIIRPFLKIDDAAVGNWSDIGGAYRGWRRALEQAGVLVCQFPKVAVSEARGFAIGNRPIPVIAVNSSDAYAGRIFTLLHELSHVLLGEGALCEASSPITTRSATDNVELFCNQVAAATLVPKASLEPYLSKATSRSLADVVTSLSRKYRVSKEVGLRRLLTLRHIDIQTYRSALQTLRDNVVIPTPKSAQIPEYIKALSRSGQFFARIVLGGYYSERITAADFAEYLDLKIKHMPKLESALYSQSGGVHSDV